MAKWMIEPFVGIGPLKFGMSRELVRAELGPDYQVFKKTPDSVNDTDAYDRISVHCYYDVQNKLDFIEIGYDSVLSIEFKGVNFFDVTVPILREHMKAAGHLGTMSHDACYFEDTGIAIYSPQSVKIEAVSAYSSERFSIFLALMQQVAERRRLRALRRQAGGGRPKNPFR
jgi:hypothetical protein